MAVSQDAITIVSVQGVGMIDMGNIIQLPMLGILDNDDNGHRGNGNGRQEPNGCGCGFNYWDWLNTWRAWCLIEERYYDAFGSDWWFMPTWEREFHLYTWLHSESIVSELDQEDREFILPRIKKGTPWHDCGIAPGTEDGIDSKNGDARMIIAELCSHTPTPYYKPSLPVESYAEYDFFLKNSGEFFPVGLVIPQFWVDRFRLDWALFTVCGEKVGIEINGKHVHGTPDGHERLCRRGTDLQMRGWQMWYLSANQVSQSKPGYFAWKFIKRYAPWEMD